MTNVHLHLDPFAYKWLSYYLAKPENHPVRKNLRMLLLLMIEPHETGIVKCPEGKKELVIEVKEHNLVGNRQVRTLVDARSAVYIRYEWMVELNRFIYNQIRDEIIRTVALKVADGGEFKDAVHLVLDRYELDDDEYSDETAFKQYQRARTEDPEISKIYRNYRRQKAK